MLPEKNYSYPPCQEICCPPKRGGIQEIHVEGHGLERVMARSARVMATSTKRASDGNDDKDGKRRQHGQCGKWGWQ